MPLEIALWAHWLETDDLTTNNSNMKKRQNNSARASALQITLSVALMAVSAILFASSFRAAAPAAPGRPQPAAVALTGPVSQKASPLELASLTAPPQQAGFFPAPPLGPT